MRAGQPAGPGTLSRLLADPYHRKARRLTEKQTVAQPSPFSDRVLHAIAGLVLLLGLATLFFRPLRGPAASNRETPRELSLLVETRLPPELKRIEHATIHLPDLPLAARLEAREGGFSCKIKSLKTPVSYQLTLYLAGGEQAVARGRLVERGNDLVAVVHEDFRKLSAGGSDLARQRAARPVSVQWQRPEYVTPKAEWLGKLEVRRNLPPHYVASEPGGHHHP